MFKVMYRLYLKSYFKWVLLILPLTLLAAKEPPPFKKDERAERIFATCQCRNCDLKDVNLSHFKPGATSPRLNPFVKMGDLNTSPAWLTCDFSGANLENAKLNDTFFQKTLRGYVTPLYDILFKDSNLKNADLSNSLFYGVQFERANLENSNLSHSDISLSNFQDANLTKANLTQSTATRDAMQGWGCIMVKADLSHGNFTKAELACDFQGANLAYAHFEKTTFTLTALDDNPTLEKTNFSHTDLRELTVEGVDNPENLFDKAILCHTIMKDGKENNRDC